MAEAPYITIILPIHNENRYIRHSLEAVINQDYPSDQIEILVADGMSDDGTRDVVLDYQNKYSNLWIIDNPGKIVPTGMNAAIRVASGKIIIRVDGHCIIAPDYVSHCIEHLENDNVDGVGGSMETIGETQLAETIAIAMSSKFGVGDSSFRTETGKTKEVDSVPFPAYTREIIERVGLYDEELIRNQDDEYNYRIRNLGGKLLLAKDLNSIYYSRGTLTSLWKQYLQYGYWKVRVLQKHPRQMRLRQFVPPVFVASILTSLILALLLPASSWLLAGIIGVYLMVNLAISMIIASNHGWKHFCLLPIVFIILHAGYGFGFLVGLIKFANRWGDREGNVPALKSITE